MNRQAAHPRPRHRKRHRRGFTLIEAVLSCLIVGIVLVPSLQLIGYTTKGQATVVERAKGLALARELLSEIMQHRYADPEGTETGETRATWDDVDDFEGLTENPPKTRAGTPLADYAGWTRQVSVKFGLTLTPNINSVVDVGLKRITVTVTSPRGVNHTVVGLRSNNDAYECAPRSGGTYASWVDITIDAGSDANVTSGVNLLNQVP